MDRDAVYLPNDEALIPQEDLFALDDDLYSTTAELCKHSPSAPFILGCALIAAAVLIVAIRIVWAIYQDDITAFYLEAGEDAKDGPLAHLFTQGTPVGAGSDAAAAAAAAAAAPTAAGTGSTAEGGHGAAARPGGHAPPPGVDDGMVSDSTTARSLPAGTAGTVGVGAAAERLDGGLRHRGPSGSAT
eukprot:TRINITY_DN123288_c0_g1_i1.p1 TRINITY_DN123288_c0_g1~~TRINITY_DN123288_c0_g1_i1.p1  ORF type:complete len:187 (-),score=35.05 TRINITY_DN123288_c0_g1_i1:179-739(-)